MITRTPTAPPIAALPASTAFWFFNPLELPRLQNLFAAAQQLRAQANAKDEVKPLARRPTVDYWGNEIDSLRMVGKVGVVPVKGPLLKGACAYDRKCGFADYGDIQEDMEIARANGARAVVLNISSPGGMAVGAGELAAFVADFNKTTPVYSFTDEMQCSAAEYLSGACTGRYATEGAIVGSIGTVMTTVSFQGMLESWGIEATVFASGKYKAAGNPYKDLTDAQREYLQGFVDTLAGEFKAHMGKYRKGMSAESMQGQVFTGKQGAANGLLSDYNLSNLSQAIEVAAMIKGG